MQLKKYTHNYICHSQIRFTYLFELKAMLLRNYVQPNWIIPWNSDHCTSLILPLIIRHGHSIINFSDHCHQHSFFFFLPVIMGHDHNIINFNSQFHQCTFLSLIMGTVMASILPTHFLPLIMGHYHSIISFINTHFLHLIMAMITALSISVTRFTVTHFFCIWLWGMINLTNTLFPP